jgi:hypothetical protein
VEEPERVASHRHLVQGKQTARVRNRRASDARAVGADELHDRAREWRARDAVVHDAAHRRGRANRGISLLRRDRVRK